MELKLAVVIVLGILVALLPLFVNIADQMYISSIEKEEIQSTSTALSTTTTSYVTYTISAPASQSKSSATPTYTVIEGEAVSHKGADTLIVKPSRVIAEPGAVIPITITVHFKHPQPCPHASWKVELYPSGGIEVISKSGSLVDPFDYVMKVLVKAESSGQLKVVYLYGAGCPYGTEEDVTVVIEVK
ncbi:MAG: hypothetical protein GXO32_04035 [Crenarchaeota archaeon]|nr:hypothetical protein [Thermoproteota archaeon]